MNKYIKKILIKLKKMFTKADFDAIDKEGNEYKLNENNELRKNEKKNNKTLFKK